MVAAMPHLNAMWMFMSDPAHGVGYSLTYRLQAEGIATCRDLQRLSLATLQRKFGVKTGEALHRHARGEDNRTLDVHHQRKSVSAEVNYGIRFTTQKEAETFLCQLAGEVVLRMKQARVKGRQVTLKLMVRVKDAPLETAKFMGHGACDNISRSSSLGAATDDTNIIYREAVNLERHLKIPPSDLRGVGIQMSRLVNTSAKGAARNTMLTNFLGMGKAVKEKNSDAKEHDGKLNRSEENERAQNTVKNNSESISTSSRSEILCVNEKTVVNVTKKTLGEKQAKQITNVNSLPRRESSKTEDMSKRNCSNEKNNTNVKSTEILSNPVPAKNNDISLLMLTPAIEVPMMTLTQARKLIRAWVMSVDVPQNCDVEMFASYIQRLVLSHHLEDVDILYSLLYRLLLNKGRQWKAAYHMIVKNTQTIMQAVYSAELKVPEFDK